jgi:hypothetical protein
MLTVSHPLIVLKTINCTGQILCVWLDISTNCENGPVPFTPVAQFFGIWHEHRRGGHHGLHEFFWEGNYVLLLNVYVDEFSRQEEGQTGSSSGGGDGAEPTTYRYLLPPEVKPLQRGEQFDKSLLVDVRRRKMNVQPVRATTVDSSCDEVRVQYMCFTLTCWLDPLLIELSLSSCYVLESVLIFMCIGLFYVCYTAQVCGAVGKQCDSAHLELLNSCEAMKEVFPCSRCSHSMGSEQPAYVSPNADPSKYNPGQCLVNSNLAQTTCAAKHPATYRLCACA